MSQEIINAISAEIATHKRCLHEEWTKPGHSADEPDNQTKNRIKDLRKNIKRLKAIRDDLETIFYGEGEEEK